MPRWIFKAAIAAIFLMPLLAKPVFAAQQQLSGTTGVQGKVPADPPSQAPTISTPSNGQNFTSSTVTVSGLCTTDLLVEVFKNGVFAGSVPCVKGSYSLQIDLFSSKNELVVRQYDGLDQASPESNKITVTLNDSLPEGTTRPTITSEYSKRGANPGDSLIWPITISGGTAPYALSVDWGDKTAPDLKSITSAGNLDLKHTYSLSGVFNVLIKIGDANGQVAFLQVVGVGNGPVKQATTGGQGQTVVKNNWALAVPMVVACAMLPVTFWLGKRHDRQTIKSNLKQGKSPF
jgi:hypothetical protein